MIASLVTLLLLAAPTTTAQAPAPAARPAATKPAAAVVPPAARALQRRALTIDDTTANTLPEIYVAGGSATVLTFPVTIAEGGALPGTSKDVFFQLAQTDKTVILMPRADLAVPVPLNVTLTDGTVLTFQCLSHPTKTDAQVDVVLAMKKRAPSESPAALKARLAQVQTELEACQTTSGDAGTAKIASLLLSSNDLDTPGAFDRRTLHRSNRAQHILVEAKAVYRLLGSTYLVLSLENRDPDRPFVVERATVRTIGRGNQQDVPVKTLVSDPPVIYPSATGRVVLAFPSSAVLPNVTVTLEEHDGNRSVTLDGLSL